MTNVILQVHFMEYCMFQVLGVYTDVECTCTAAHCTLYGACTCRSSVSPFSQPLL